MSRGFLLFAIVAILFLFYFSTTAGNHVNCQVSKYVPSGVILISNDVMYPEINGRIPDEDKNFTGSVKEPSILNISNIIGRISDEDKNFTGSVKEPSILNITQTQLNMSLIEAANRAEKLTGNDSRVVDAKLATRNGYIVYEVLLVGNTSDRPFTWLIIDPGSREGFADKMTCKCDECKQFAGKWICTGCRCTS
jgi:hypothetical protein